MDAICRTSCRDSNDGRGNGSWSSGVVSGVDVGSEGGVLNRDLANENIALFKM